MNTAAPEAAKRVQALLLAVLLLLSACASAGSVDEAEEDDFAMDHGMGDPLEPINRAIFDFNEVVYGGVLWPVAHTYETITPGFFRTGVDNFFTNLRFPIRFVNSALQAKGEKMLDETGRFVINTTIGGLGLVDIATNAYGEAPPSEDFDQTLGVWGLPSGPYLVLPILGPSSVRGVVGMVGDSFLHPLNYVNSWEIVWAARGLEYTNKLPTLLGQYERLRKGALDPYASLHSAYAENTQYEVGR